MNEICEDHWFYHTCQCRRPFFGDHCDQSTSPPPSSLLEMSFLF